MLLLYVNKFSILCAVYVTILFHLYSFPACCCCWMWWNAWKSTLGSDTVYDKHFQSGKENYSMFFFRWNIKYHDNVDWILVLFGILKHPKFFESIRIFFEIYSCFISNQRWEIHLSHLLGILSRKCRIIIQWFYIMMTRRRKMLSISRTVEDEWKKKLA